MKLYWISSSNMKVGWGGKGGGHIDPPRINYLQKAKPLEHKVEMR